MLGIAVSTLRTRKGGFAAAFVALLFAAALVGACGILLETGLRGGVPPQRYAGTSIIAAADQDLHFVIHKHGKSKSKVKPATETVELPAADLALVRAVPGVGSATPEVTFPAAVRGALEPESSWGHAWQSASLTPFTLRTGRAPAAADEVVVDAATHARVDEHVVIRTAEAARTYTVVGVTREALADEGAVFFDGADARRLAGGRLTAIGVEPAPGIDATRLSQRIEATVPGVRAYTGAGRGIVEFRKAASAKVALVSVSAALGGIALLVAVLVVINTCVLSIQQREREIALLRAVAATPRQIRRMLSREMQLVGIVAAMLGASGGIPLAHWLRSSFVGLDVMPESLRLVVGPLPLLVAAGVTVIAAWLSSRGAARHAGRIGPVAALTDAAAEPRRTGPAAWIAGAVFLTGGVGLMLVLRRLHSESAAMPVTLLTVVSCAAGVALLGAPVVRAAAVVVCAPMRLLSRASGLVSENVSANARRTAAIAVPLTLTVAMATVAFFAEPTVDRAARRQFAAGTVAAYGLRASWPGVPTTVADAVRRVPGVTTVTQVASGTIWIGDSHYVAQGVTPGGLASTIDPLDSSGSIDKMSVGTVALSRATAAAIGKRVGDSLDLRLSDGTSARLRVIAVYERGLGFGAVMVPYGLLIGHVDVPAAETVLVAASPSARPAITKLARRDPDIELLDGSDAWALSVTRHNSGALDVALALIVAFTAISLVNTVAMSIMSRRWEFALLRLIGMTRRQVHRTLCLEVVVAAVIGMATGGLIAAGALIGFAAGITGSPALAVSLARCAELAASTLALACLATLVSSRLALHASPAMVTR